MPGSAGGTASASTLILSSRSSPVTRPARALALDFATLGVVAEIRFQIRGTWEYRCLIYTLLSAMLRLLVLSLLTLSVTAQFQFFDQFFGGQQQPQHQQEKQNVASDSKWYQQNWEQGMFPFFLRV